MTRSIAVLVLAAAAAVLAPGCDDDARDRGADAGGSGAIELLGAPFAFAPNASGFGLNVALARGSPSQLRCRVRAPGAAWSEAAAPAVPADDVAQWAFDQLEPATRYQYRLVAVAADRETPLYEGEITTQREPGAEFEVALLGDTHIRPRVVSPGGLEIADDVELTLSTVAMEIASFDPDFTINLGDTLDFHAFGFNDPPPEGRYTRLGYLNYRRLLGELPGKAAHFGVVGNWDGENGDYSAAEIARSREQRLLYAPGPKPDTYPEGGSAWEDYYAFTWGDALFVVLNVMTYTKAAHRLGFQPGLADDWTLGEPQLSWLTATLENAASKWRFLFIHHTVGGAAGDDANSAYGRGGGQAAKVGEQAVVHDLMVRHGVQIFFYGHDHVFTDMIVDDIHYSLPGSAGAPWKFTTAETGYTDYWSDSGHARVRVSPERVTVEFVAIGGEVIHAYTLE